VDDRQQQDWERRRRMRSRAIAVVLFALVVIFYIATVVWLGGNVASRRL
jgi:fatty acid desaturase